MNPPFLTAEQIDHVVAEMAKKAEQYSHTEILDKMSEDAKLELDLYPELRERLDCLVQDAFLEGVGQAMFHIGAMLERRVKKEDDA